jgi:nucleotide-binding universal stress UspA family protein
VACLDGSDFSEVIVNEATAWAAALDVPLWLVEVVDPEAAGAGIETNYVHNVARKLEDSGVDLEWDVLHSRHPEKAILDWVDNDPTTILAMATHGRTGLRRVLLGSVVADVIHGAAGPVITCVPAK